MEFIDKRGQLPQHATLRYGVRKIEDLLGTCDHHTAGNPHMGDDGKWDSHVEVARYHSGPNSHLKEGGAPGIAYTYVIEPDGTIIECWDLTVKTWSQGFRDRKGDENAQFVSINHVGNFESKSNRSGKRPTQQQILASIALHLHLTGNTQDPRIPERLFGAVPYGPGDRFGHLDFGKPACPGDDVAILGELAQHHASPNLVGDKAWQEALLSAGYAMVKYGADGDWGMESREALVRFQRDHGLEATGQRDKATEKALVDATV